jgi:hypothetical protein
MFGGGFSDLDYDGSSSSSSNVYEDKLKGQGSDLKLSFLFGYDFGLLAFQTELLFSSVTVKHDYYYSSTSGPPSYTYTYRDEETEFSRMTLQIPVMLKLDFHFWRLMLQPQAGIYFNFGLGGMDYETEYSSSSGSGSSSGDYDCDTPLFGVMAGVAMGVRIGRGYLFMDFRYAMDLGETKIYNYTSSGIEYTRHSFAWSLGYQYYFK